MSLARKSLDGELRRPARLFSGRTGSWVRGGSSPRHGELLCNVPCAGGIKGLMEQEPLEGDVFCTHFIYLFF